MGQDNIDPGAKINAGNLAKDVTFMMSMPRMAFTDNMYCLQNATYKLGLWGQRHGGAFWEQGIENLLEEAIAKGYKYGLAIDYDTFYSCYNIVDLYNLMEKNPHIDVLVPLQTRRGNEYPMCGTFEDPRGDRVRITRGNFVDGIADLDTGHFGLTMIRLAALKKLSSPWFISVPSERNDWRQGHKDADVHFWIKCKKDGLTVKLAEVWIGHMELMCAFPGPSGDDNFKTHYLTMNQVLSGELPKWTAPKSASPKTGL